MVTVATATVIQWGPQRLARSEEGEVNLPDCRHAKDEQFYHLVEAIVDTRGFFKLLQEERGEKKHGMEAIVNTYGSQEDRDRYNRGAHSALIDALSLSKLCGAMKEDFSNWIHSDTIRSLCFSKKLHGRFSDWLIWERTNV